MKEERIRNVEKVEVTGWEASLPSAPSSLRAQLTSPLREGLICHKLEKCFLFPEHMKRPGECVQRC